MDHLHYEFEGVPDDVIEVSLDRAANVQLLDTANYDAYRSGRGFHYQGGYATTSPVRFPVTERGRWHVVIDLGGGAGRVRASARVVSGSPV